MVLIRFITLALAGLLIALPMKAQAEGFSEQDHRFAMETYQNPYVGRFTTTVQGINQEMRRFGVIGPSYEKVRVASPWMGSGEIEVRLHTEPGYAPLAVILPPLYDTNLNFQSTRFIEFFARRGFHVVVIPNTWSTLVTRESPRFFPGDIHTETKFVAAAIEEAVARIGAGRVSRRVLVGTSYGAFLSAVMKAEDAASAQPKFSGPVTLLSPPLDILNSMHQLDRQAAESVAEGGEDCTGALALGWFLPKTFLAMSPDDLPGAEKCSKAFLTLVGFRDSLKEMVSAVAPERSRVGGLTYDLYSKEIAHLPIVPQETDIGYWLRTAEKGGFRNWRIFSPLDDTINDGKVLSENSYFAFDPLETITVQSGGHIGFRSSGVVSPPCSEGEDWLDCLLIKTYPKNPTNASR